MYHTIRPFYYWPGIKREIVEYVSMCVSVVSRSSRKKEIFWVNAATSRSTVEMGNIIMDFVYKLPRTRNGCDGVWVIVDRLTKSAQLIILKQMVSQREPFRL